MKHSRIIYRISCLFIIIGLMLCSCTVHAVFSIDGSQSNSTSIISNDVSDHPKSSTTVSSIKFCSYVKGTGSYTEVDDAIFTPNGRLFIYFEIYDAFRHQITTTITVTAPDGSIYLEETEKESPLFYTYAKWWEKEIDSFDFNGEYRVQIQVTDRTKNQNFIETGSFFVRDAAPLIAITMEDLPVQMGIGTYQRIKVNLYNLDPSFVGTSTITVRLSGSAFGFPDGNARAITLGPNERRDIYFTVIPNSFGIKTLRVEILFKENVISYEDYSISVTVGYIYAIPIAAIIGIILIFFFKRSKPQIQITEMKSSVISSIDESDEQDVIKDDILPRDISKEITEPSPTETILLNREMLSKSPIDHQYEDSNTKKYFELDTTAKDTHKKLVKSLIKHKKEAEGIKLPKIEKEILKKEILCANCGNLMPEGTSVCPACQSDQISCPICLRPIIFGEKIIKCSYCGVFSHEDHYIQWVATKGYCPKCKTKIRG
ncbi:hypothetical protein [Candidatus Borrarchaeum sp.]|uniref:hypothetical protein n=1 Tax=Candidatus Borrarchaeum sp. TaxID=2846742 RepID=UPI00257BA6F7|nr:hypothetical protein [Candidatus Borrarchaeum sp.]